MKSYALHSESGGLVGFEVSHSFLSSGGIARFVAKVPGTEVTQKRRWFSAEEIHVRFTFSGLRFIVWEPFGDNSRLRIGPDDEEAADTAVISELRDAFESTNRWGLLA